MKLMTRNDCLKRKLNYTKGKKEKLNGGRICNNKRKKERERERKKEKKEKERDNLVDKKIYIKKNKHIIIIIIIIKIIMMIIKMKGFRQLAILF